MFSYVPFKYKTVSWSRPVGWTTAQEIQMGEQVHRFGKDHFIKQFLAPPAVPVEADPPAMHGPGETPSFTFRPFSKDRPPGIVRRSPSKTQGTKSHSQGVAAGAIAAGTVVATAFLAPHILTTALAAGTYAGGMYYGSKRYALWKFNRWLNHCEGKYLESIKPKPSPPPIPPPTPVVSAPRPAPVQTFKVPQPQDDDFLIKRAIMVLVIFVVIVLVIAMAGGSASQSRTAPVTVVSPTPQDQHQNHMERFEASRSKAERTYPDLLNPSSPLAKEVQAMIASMQANHDPILNDPDAPMWITVLAAGRVAIRTTVSPTPTPPQTAKVVKKSPPATPRPTPRKPTASPQIVAATPPTGPWLKPSEMPAKYMEIQYVDWSKLPSGRWGILSVGGRYSTGGTCEISENEAIERSYSAECPLFVRTNQGFTRVYASSKYEDGSLTLHTWADTPKRFILMELPKIPKN